MANPPGSGSHVSRANQRRCRQGTITAPSFRRRSSSKWIFHKPHIGELRASLRGYGTIQVFTPKKLWRSACLSHPRFPGRKSGPSCFADRVKRGLPGEQHTLLYRGAVDPYHDRPHIALCHCSSGPPVTPDLPRHEPTRGTTPSLHHSITPSLHHSITPSLHLSTTPPPTSS